MSAVRPKSSRNRDRQLGSYDSSTDGKPANQPDPTKNRWGDLETRIGLKSSVENHFQITPHLRALPSLEISITDKPVAIVFRSAFQALALSASPAVGHGRCQTMCFSWVEVQTYAASDRR
jgi:hypothetical protein